MSGADRRPSGHLWISGTDTLAEWQRIRRYAVPKSMIASCAAARATGDWRLACDAGNVEVLFDPASLNAPDAARIVDILTGFAPDLARWHLPRALGGHTTLATDIDFVLTGDGPIGPATVVLILRSPRTVTGSQRLALDVVRAGELDVLRTVPLAPYHWDHRRAPELRAAVGGSARRVPLFASDGMAMPPAALGAGDDAPARAERVVLAQGTDESWTEAGIVMHDAFEPRTYRARWGRAVGAAINPLRLVAEARRLNAQFGQTAWIVPYNHHQVLRIDVDGDTVHATATLGSRSRDNRELPRLAPAMLRFPIDLELIWHGRLTPADLHPLVRAALFPAAGPSESPPPVALSIGSKSATPPAVSKWIAPPTGPATTPSASEPAAPPSAPAITPSTSEPAAPPTGRAAAPSASEPSAPPTRPAATPPVAEPAAPPSAARLAASPFVSEPAVPASGPVRVRCRGVWHEVRHRAGRLELLAHSAVERQRERAFRAFGGEVTGCFAAEQAWTGGPGRLPKQLRAERNDLWLRILHGGTPVVLDLLDDGLDPDFRDSRGRTLAHQLRAFDHTQVLPRLLARGADLDARDREGHTPLATAVAHGWPLPLVRALVEAGADLNVPSANWPQMTILEALDFIEGYVPPNRSADAQAVVAYLRQL